AAELTADRFSLLAANGQMEAFMRLEIAATTLDSPRELGLHELEHLADVCRRMEAREPPVFNGYYPSSAFRTYATWLFWRSEVHRELTGVGPGDLRIRDVDATLRAMCDEALPDPKIGWGMQGALDKMLGPANAEHLADARKRWAEEARARAPKPAPPAA